MNPLKFDSFINFILYYKSWSVDLQKVLTIFLVSTLLAEYVSVVFWSLMLGAKYLTLLISVCITSLLVIFYILYHIFKIRITIGCNRYLHGVDISPLLPLPDDLKQQISEIIQTTFKEPISHDPNLYICIRKVLYNTLMKYLNSLPNDSYFDIQHVKQIVNQVYNKFAFDIADSLQKKTIVKDCILKENLNQLKETHIECTNLR